MKIRSVLLDRIEATAPWSLHSTCGPEIKFASVLRGTGTLNTPLRAAAVPVASGDVFVMLEAADFVISDGTAAEPIECSQLNGYRTANAIRFGGGGSPTTLLLGSFEIDRKEVEPILHVLPGFLHLKLDARRAHSFQSVLDLLALETEQPGLASEAVIGRLCEMLFIHTIRVHAQTLAGNSGGWLAGLADAQLGSTLTALHNNLGWDWTVESMASHAGMSRSGFAARFKHVVGQSPLDYLTQWRMHRAGLLMRRKGSNIAQIARVVGYKSESAFTKVFKKTIGTTPSDYRGGAFRSLSSPGSTLTIGENTR
jgi:AraC-like DNA-binding protein